MLPALTPVNAATLFVPAALTACFHERPLIALSTYSLFAASVLAVGVPRPVTRKLPIARFVAAVPLKAIVSPLESPSTTLPCTARSPTLVCAPVTRIVPATLALPSTTTSDALV